MCFFKQFKINRLNKKLRAFQSARVHNPAGEEALKKELACYMKLAELYHGLIGHKKYPFATRDDVVQLYQQRRFFISEFRTYLTNMTELIEEIEYCNCQLKRILEKEQNK